ncbi:MAG: 50S ribosomal protein L13 [Candidatus Kerfeldbacteria bacterium]|nr:50S ribosomal protein L13 [Candidatus Kerfeldbacteria bacterium]
MSSSNVPSSHETIDATNQSLGRVASRAARLLRGKHLPDFDPAAAPRVTVSITHARQLHFSGKKTTNQFYAKFSGYPGGLKQTSLGELFARSPERIVRLAVARMLPRNKLRRRFLAHLNVTP